EYPNIPIDIISGRVNMIFVTGNSARQGEYASEVIMIKAYYVYVYGVTSSTRLTVAADSPEEAREKALDALHEGLVDPDWSCLGPICASEDAKVEPADPDTEPDDVDVR